MEWQRKKRNNNKIFSLKCMLKMLESEYFGIKVKMKPNGTYNLVRGVETNWIELNYMKTTALWIVFFFFELYKCLILTVCARVYLCVWNKRIDRITPVSIIVHNIIFSVGASASVNCARAILGTFKWFRNIFPTEKTQVSIRLTVCTKSFLSLTMDYC